METLAVMLEPHKELVGNVAGFVTVGQMFSGCFLCYDMFKQGSTKGVGIIIFVGGLIMSVLNLKYGFILRDSTMINVNFIGLALNILYLMVYFHYSQEKTKAWAQTGAGAGVAGALLLYAEYEQPHLVETRLGLVITAFMFYLIASPLFGLGEIIKNKSTEGMPFPIILSGTVVTFMWLLYGIILRNQFIVVQNIVAFSLCSAQLALFVIYPAKKTDAKAKAKKAD